MQGLTVKFIKITFKQIHRFQGIKIKFVSPSIGLSCAGWYKLIRCIRQPTSIPQIFLNTYFVVNPVGGTPLSRWVLRDPCPWDPGSVHSASSVNRGTGNKTMVSIWFPWRVSDAVFKTEWEEAVGKNRGCRARLLGFRRWRHRLLARWLHASLRVRSLSLQHGIILFSRWVVTKTKELRYI